MRGGWANRYAIAAGLLFVAAALYFVLIELHRPAATPALDVYVYFLPNKLHAVYSALRGGSGLLWNPYQSCGEPFFANTAMGLLYPPHLLFLVLDPNVALHVVLILNMVLGAAGMCLLARQVGLGWAAAIGAALVLELGDPMSHLTGWSPMQNGPWAWAPWALFLCERLLRRPSRGGVAALAAVLLWMLIRDLEPIRRRRKKAELPAAWRPEPAAARALLDEADALAAAGQYAEAIHLLLFRSIEDLSQRRAGSAPPAFTSREIVETVEMPGPARGAFARIAAAVELSFFGGRPAGADDFQTCRRDYEAFAFAEGWR